MSSTRQISSSWLSLLASGPIFTQTTSSFMDAVAHLPQSTCRPKSSRQSTPSMPGCHQIVSHSTLGRRSSYGLVHGMVLPNVTRINSPINLLRWSNLPPSRISASHSTRNSPWRDHVSKLCQSCYFQLRQIRTIRHSLSPSAIRTLVHAFICSRIDFSNSLLYGTSTYLLDRLQSVLNSSARLILKLGKYDPISAAIRRDLHWLPIQARIRFKMNVITRNCLVGQAPEYLAELCRPINEVPARCNLRSAAQVQLLVPRFRKERTGRRGFSISSPQLWNSLPVDIRILYEEPHLFRKRLKTHLMQQFIFHHWGSMSPVRHLLLLLLSTCKQSLQSFTNCLRTSSSLQMVSSVLIVRRLILNVWTWISASQISAN